MDALPDSGSMQKLALPSVQTNSSSRMLMALLSGKGQVKYHRKSKQKWKQGTGQISPGNRRLEFGDGRNWEAAFSARTTSRGLRTGRRAIGSHSNRLSANKFRLEAWISVFEETASERSSTVNPRFWLCRDPANPIPPIWLRNSAEPLMNSIRAGLNISAEQIKN